jgi:predicted dehydrogenase
MAMSDSRRIFLLGAGTMAREHARAAVDSGQGLEVHAADPSEAARAAFAKRFPAATLYSDGEEMLSTPAQDDDLAIVATPPWLHLPHIELAARSGRHILCEKPLLRSSDEIPRVAELIRSTGRVLACCSVRFQENPATERVAELVAAGELGDLYAGRLLQGPRNMRAGIEYQPESSFFLDRSRNGGGVVMDYAAYDLTTLLRILKPRAITVLHAAMAQPELPVRAPDGVVFDVETHAVATLLFERADGTQLTLHYERQTGSFERDLDEATLTGTRGSVSWSCMGYEGDITLSLRNADDEEGKVQIFEPPAGDNWVHDAPLLSTLDLLAGRPNRALAGGDVLFQIATLRAIYDVAESGKPVTLRRDTYADLPGSGAGVV